MNRKCLEYDSLKSVLLHMDPNLRIKLCTQIPSIRSVEKNVPMKISYLTTRRDKTIINDTTYSVGIHRQYHNLSEMPRYDRKCNREGGYPIDLDQWGFRAYPDSNKRTAGDVTFSDTDRTNLDEGFDRIYVETVVCFEEAARRLKLLNGTELEPDYVIPEQRVFPNASEILAQNEARVRYLMTKPVAQLQETIDPVRSVLLASHYKRNNILAPCTRYIQVSINGNVIETVERTRSLYQAMKYLNSVIFGDRRYPVRVKQIAIPMFTSHLFFSADMKIKVRQTLTCRIEFEKLTSFIDESSYPLETLTVQSTPDAVDFYQQDVVKSAKKLIIFNYLYDNEPWIPLIQNLRNQTIVLKHRHPADEARDYIGLIESWLQSDRWTGHNLTIGFSQEEDVREILDQVSIHFDAMQIDDS